MKIISTLIPFTSKIVVFWHLTHLVRIVGKTSCLEMIEGLGLTRIGKLISLPKTLPKVSSHFYLTLPMEGLLQIEHHSDNALLTNHALLISGRLDLEGTCLTDRVEGVGLGSAADEVGLVGADHALDKTYHLRG